MCPEGVTRRSALISKCMTQGAYMANMSTLLVKIKVQARTYKQANIPKIL